MLKRTLKVCLFVLVGCGSATAGLPKVNYAVSDAEIAVHIFHESSGNDGAIGDQELKHKAYGPLQIRKRCVDDVNKRFGTNYKPEDCWDNRPLSIWLAKAYWSIWATKKRLGHEPTALDRAGIWNGGPNGYKSSDTVKYRQKYQALAKKLASEKKGKKTNGG